MVAACMRTHRGVTGQGTANTGRQQVRPAERRCLHHGDARSSSTYRVMSCLCQHAGTLVIWCACLYRMLIYDRKLKHSASGQKPASLKKNRSAEPVSTVKNSRPAISD